METLGKSMGELGRFARGEANDVSVNVINLEGVNKMSEVRLSVMGRDKWLKRLDKNIKAKKVKSSKGKGYADYRIITEEDPRDFVFKLSDEYPSLEFVYNFNKRSME